MALFTRSVCYFSRCIWTRRTICPRHLLIAALPYLVAAGAWVLYISRDVEAFHSQFAFNASLGGRFNGFVHPLVALRQELVEQYGGSFGFASGESHFKLVFFCAYFAGDPLGSLRPLRKRRGESALLWLALGYFLMQTLFNQKVWVYLVHILPLYAAILAVVFWRVGPALDASRCGGGVSACALPISDSGCRIPVQGQAKPQNRLREDRCFHQKPRGS